MILEHPWIYLSNSLRAALPLLFAPLRSSIDLQLGLSERGSSLLYWGQTAGRGLIPLLLENTSGPTLVLVLVVGIYFLVVSTGPEAYARFRVPLMPFLAALAGWGAAILRYRDRREKPGKQ